MQKGWRIGTLFDIPFFIDPSWFPIAALVTVVNAFSFSQQFPPLPSLLGGVVMALALFSSVLLHELGHSLVAQSQGITVRSISLFLFGGVASIERESRTPLEAFQVAIAGPAVSLALFLLFRGFTPLFPSHSLSSTLLVNLGFINLGLVLFNLIPGLPLDGGQVLKALVWQVSQDPIKGIRWAAASGKGIGLLAITLGLTLMLLTGEIGAVWLALIGGFILRNARRYDELATVQATLMNISARDVMTRDFWDVTSGNITRALFGQAGPAIAEDATLQEVINCLETYRMRSVPVISTEGNVTGQIDRGDVVKALVERLSLPISEVEVEEARLQARYPRLLPLPAITKAMVPKL